VRPSTDPAPSCPAPRRARRRSLDSLLVAGAVLAQGAMLARGAPPGFAGLALTAVAAVLCAIAWGWRGRVPHLDFVVAATAFGGLGMAAAAMFGVDGGHGAHGMAHGGGASHGYGGAVVGMLVVCVPACAWRCDPLSGGGFARQALALAIATAGMLAGMAAGGWAAGPWLAGPLGAAAGMHVAMVVGMAVGTAASLPAVALLERASRRAHGTREAASPA
jgi:hypothetical protein